MQQITRVTAFTVGKDGVLKLHPPPRLRLNTHAIPSKICIYNFFLFMNIELLSLLFALNRCLHTNFFLKKQLDEIDQKTQFLSQFSFRFYAPQKCKEINEIYHGCLRLKIDTCLACWKPEHLFSRHYLHSLYCFEPRYSSVISRFSDQSARSH